MRIAVRSWIVLAVLSCVGIVWAEENVAIVPDVVYGHKDGMALTMDVFQPKSANGAGVLFMVSGGWYSNWTPPEQLKGMFQPLLDEGFTVFAVRHGSSPKYVVPEVVEDVRRSVRFVRAHAGQYGVDSERLGVTGMSAGGHLSLMLGTTGDDGDPSAKDELLHTSDRVAAVVAWCPPTDLQPWVDEKSWYYQKFPALRFEADKADDCSPLLRVSKDDAPALMIHGDKDDLVPIEHSRKILERFQSNGVPAELLLLEGSDHGFRDVNLERARKATVEWFKKYLAKK
jgi:acetyl esterase/lipase